jgi:hypothetical protein
MNQLKLDLYWNFNKTAVRRGLSLIGVGCSATSEVEVISTLFNTWERPTGTRAWRRMKPLARNLRTG